MKLVSLLSVLWSLVEVHSFPYVSFMGQTLKNHAYVDLSLVGDVNSDTSGSNNVQCHTDLNTCCSISEGPHRGDWYFPAGGRLPLLGGDDIYQNHGTQSVDLRRRNNANLPTGIYRCDIPTAANSSVKDTVYVGLYTSDGGKLPLYPHSLILY